MRTNLLSSLFAIIFISLTCVQFALAQIKVTGKVTDANTHEPLTGSTIIVKGTTTATTTSLDGSFKITAPTDSQVLVVSFVGYVPKEIAIGDGKSDMGNITLQPASASMREVIINGDIAIDRKTPVAVSTLSPQFIEEKLGNQDIPQLLSITPGVTATATGGGYGDSRISIRGFSSSSGQGNVALTVNGIPVNDMENGAIFWSDFSGLTDVVTSIQIQRGLGASKIIVPSFGGTINITTRNTDAVRGGYISQAIGSDAYEKTAVLISTGLDKNGWAATFQGARTMGNGNADGLNFLGYNYFFNLSKVLTPNQTLSFSVMGATQTHGQRPSQPIVNYQNAPQGIRWNFQNSVKDGGQSFTPYNNFFSKPLFSINHDWTINDKSSLSTILYGTYGTGGGGSIGGALPPRVAGANIYTPFDYSAVEKSNATSADGSAGTYLYASHNDHVEYGVRSTYKTILGQYLDLSVGIDARYYEGTHYQVITDLLGADYVKNNYTPASLGNRSGDINNPVQRPVVGDKITYFNKDAIQTTGAYTQAEYSKNNFSAFVTLSVAEQGDKRRDYFNYLNSDPAQTSPWVNFVTYMAKTGANYNINEQMNIFANIGYITKPPFFDRGVYQSFTNIVNPHPVDEKLFSYELGYGYKLPGFSAKVNIYRSTYKDQTLTSSFNDNNGNIFTGNVSGVNSLYQGGELELKAKPVKFITLTGMLSMADNHFTNNPGPANIYNSSQVVVKTISKAYLQNIKIGDAAQTTAALGIDLDFSSQLRIGADYYYTGNYYSRFTSGNITTAGLTPYKIPNYSIVNLNAVFKFKLAGFDASFIANVMNVMNTKYISDSFDASASGLPANVSVYYGLGRTFTTGLKIKF